MITLSIGHVLAFLAQISWVPILACLIGYYVDRVVRGWDRFAEWALAETKATKEPPR